MYKVNKVIDVSLTCIIILLLIMNIASSIPIQNQSNNEQKLWNTTHSFKQTLQPKLSQSNRLISKSSKSIRIKSKSTTLRNFKQHPYTSSIPNNIMFLNSAPKSHNQVLEKQQSIQNELVFLKELIKKKKQTPQRSVSQAQTLQNFFPKNEQTQSKNDPKLFQGHAFKNTTTSLLKGCQQYRHYDIMVRDLLSQMKTRKVNNQKKKRPSISPSKYSESKSKTLHPLSSGQCNFKNMFKLNPKKQNMVFRIQDSVADNVYQRKITNYLMFLYKINFTNAIYVDLSLKNGSQLRQSIGKKQKCKWKVRIGRGNNSELIKSLIKRRFWLQILTLDDKQQPNFIWTQATIDSYHKSQMECKQKTIQEIQKQRNPILSKKLKRKIKEQSNQTINKKLFVKDCLQQSIDVQRLFWTSNYGNYSVFKNHKAQTITNHLPQNYIIGSKKILFILMFWYYQNIKKVDPFTILPKTYHIKSGETNNLQFKKFMEKEGSKVEQVWIIKPGQNTNRGIGITVASLAEIDRLIHKKQTHKNGQQKTYIIQKYLKPFLYNGRKFDIRHFLLITSVNGYIKAYWYKEGYLRTSSEKYDLEDLSNEFIHLTNDAIQKKSEYYGKYQAGNKISYQNFQRYLDQNYPHKRYSLFEKILPKMKQITRQLIEASYIYMDPSRKSSNFELYGMDFMIDSKFNPYLIQVNANPCLQTSCPLLERIVPVLVQHSLRVGLDPLFPPPQHYPANYRFQLSDRILQKLKYEIIFDERVQGSKIAEKIDQHREKFMDSLQKQFKKGKNIGQQLENLQPDQQIYDDDGEAPLSDIDLQ